MECRGIVADVVAEDGGRDAAPLAAPHPPDRPSAGKRVQPGPNAIEDGRWTAPSGSGPSPAGAHDRAAGPERALSRSGVELFAGGRVRDRQTRRTRGRRPSPAAHTGPIAQQRTRTSQVGHRDDEVGAPALAREERVRRRIVRVADDRQPTMPRR